MRVLLTACGVAILLAGFQVNPATAAEAPTVHTTIGVEAVKQASAEIPPQPLADPATGLPLATGGSESSRGVDPRNGYSRTCERGFGVEAWNVQVIDACAGTVKWYYNTVYRKTLNVLVMQASMPPRTTIDLDAWCSSHSFACTALWTFVGMGFTVVWGIIS
ncbi:hypothetical protein [Microbacterium sp. CJ88]|uniref:hypothetical protein n=1 Tax=Microbacterium sp. CJ88 TaxID=3445672 RepID=UPI003F658847